MASALDHYQDIFQIPGALTAETVRYLRYHHATPALQQLDPDVVQEIRESLHPDQLDKGKPYWFLVQALVKQGNLEQAWDLLTRHSLYRRANYAIPTDEQGNFINDDDDYEMVQLKNYREGFEDLRRLFHSAPLPGGRDEADDVGLDGPESPGRRQKQQHDTVLLVGVPTNAYQLWETSPMTYEGNDFPIGYNPGAASITRERWIQYVVELESVRKLKRRIPQLDSILKILSGNWTNVQFDTWAEALLCELIYKYPSILPGNIQVRAKKLMEQYPRVHAMDSCLLSIMEGSAGSVVSALYVFGGGSGAALPATMTSLLCNLYADPNDDLPRELQLDLLKSAALAISSSLAGPNSDIGARMVVRLLLPYAKPNGDLSIVATIAETLDRHTPGSDVAARNLIDLCRKLIDKKSERIVEGCVSLCLSRYRSLLNDDRPGGALHWLLVGLELESKLCRDKDGEIRDWQSIEAVSVCYRYLVTWCVRVSGALLLGILEEREGVRLVYETAKAMVIALKEGPMEGYVANLLEVVTLVRMLGIYDGLKDSSDWTPVATNIKLLLEEKPNEYDGGVVTTTAPRCLHYGLLLLGHRVIEADERRILTAKKGDHCSSFDVPGIQVLLEQLTLIPLNLELERLKPIPEDLLAKIRLSLAKALSRAFVKENARRKPHYTEEENDVDISKIKSCDLNKYSIEIQERVVQFMLDC